MKKNWLVKMSQLNMQSVGFAVKQILYIDQRAVAIVNDMTRLKTGELYVKCSGCY